MNEKLLEQKAEEKFKTKPLGYEMKPELDIYTDGYIDGVTEETKLLSEHILELQKDKGELVDENKELKDLVEKYRQATDKILHITFMGGGCEVNTIGQYATLVDGYLTDVEGLAKWKN